MFVGLSVASLGIVQLWISMCRKLEAMDTNFRACELRFAVGTGLLVLIAVLTASRWHTVQGVLVQTAVVTAKAQLVL